MLRPRADLLRLSLCCVPVPPGPGRVGGVPLGLSSRGSQPEPGRVESGRALGDEKTGTGAVRGGEGEGEGSERRRHKMAAAPGAGPPDPCASVLLSCLQVAMATGQVLFHRFFYSKSFVKHSFEVSRAGAGEGGFFSSGNGKEGGGGVSSQFFQKGSG